MKPWMGVTPPPRGFGYYPDEYGEAPELKPYQTPWKQVPASEDWFGDDFRLRYELDVAQYIGELSRRMQEAEDAVAEPLVVDWLRSRGWTVEKEGEDG